MALRDVLQLRLAKVLHVERHFPRRILTHASRDADAACIGQSLQTGSDIDAITEQVTSLGYHVALVQADPNLKAVIRAQPLLDGDGAAQRLHRGRELSKQTVA